MTKKQLQGLTVKEIKSQYPNGEYKSSMKKDEVIDTALKTVKKPAETVSKSPNREPAYR